MMQLKNVETCYNPGGGVITRNNYSVICPFISHSHQLKSPKVTGTETSKTDFHRQIYSFVRSLYSS